MLVISRGDGDRLYLDIPGVGRVVIDFMADARKPKKRLKVGITAPPEVVVTRGELVDYQARRPEPPCR